MWKIIFKVIDYLESKLKNSLIVQKTIYSDSFIKVRSFFLYRWFVSPFVFILQVIYMILSRLVLVYCAYIFLAYCIAKSIFFIFSFFYEVSPAFREFVLYAQYIITFIIFVIGMKIANSNGFTIDTTNYQELNARNNGFVSDSERYRIVQERKRSEQNKEL